MKTKDTIRNCPLVWRLDKDKNDIYTHDKDEVPCGFVPETSEIKARKLVDGRTMLSTVAYVWKRYTGPLLDFFKRDGHTKPISVEMTVLSSEENQEGKIELLDYKFIGITILGSSITPAIPLASANILSYGVGRITNEYKEAVKKEFFNDISLEIPKKIKENSKKGLSLIRESNVGATSVALSFGKYISDNNHITPDKVRYMADHIPKTKPSYLKGENSPTEEYVEWLLFGGDDSLIWSIETSKALKAREIAYEKLEYSDTSLDINTIREETAMKNKDKIQTEESTEEVVEEMASEEEEEVVEEMTSEESTEEVVEEMASEESTEEVVEEMASEESTEEVVEEMASEEEEEGEDESEEEQVSENSFQYPDNFNMETMMGVFAGDEDEDIKMALEEMATDFCKPEVMISAMFTKIMSMAKKIGEMEEESKSYMAENEELKAYKASIEEEKKFARVQAFLVDLGNKVVVPEETMTEFRENSNNFAIEELDVWESQCKAKSFDFAIRDGKEGEIKIALPFKSSSLRKPNSDIWHGAK